MELFKKIFCHSVKKYVTALCIACGLTVAYLVLNGDNHIKFYFEGKEVFEWKIVAHDNDKIIIDTYYKEQQSNEKYGEFLYSRQLFIRKIDETKCWENAKPYK